jgi:hypothetical protein
MRTEKQNRTRRFSQMSPDNKLARLLDKRENASALLTKARFDLQDVEREILIMVVNDPVGFEDCISINWKRLERIFGG